LNANALRVIFAQESDAGCEAFRRLAAVRLPSTHVSCLKDGQAVLDHFFKSPAGAAKVDVLFLDRRIPKRDALDVFTEIRLSPRFDALTVVFLVDSAREEELLKNSFNCPSVRKPVEENLPRLLKLCEELSRQKTAAS
jgi:CheY-like chemotaxis protein